VIYNSEPWRKKFEKRRISVRNRDPNYMLPKLQIQFHLTLSLTEREEFYKHNFYRTPVRYFSLPYPNFGPPSYPNDMMSR
jgi:hypothetical protein